MTFLGKLHERFYCFLFGHWWVNRPAEGLQRCICCQLTREIKNAPRKDESCKYKAETGRWKD